MIQINATQFYDCFRKRSVCKASMANCSRGIVHRLSGAPGVANSGSRIGRKGGNVHVRLVSTNAIPANTEILHSYMVLPINFRMFNKKHALLLYYYFSSCYEDNFYRVYNSCRIVLQLTKRCLGRVIQHKI